jgi:hypothetical protein
MYRVIGVLLVTLTALSAQASIDKLGAHPLASEPAANEQRLNFSRLQGALR